MTERPSDGPSQPLPPAPPALPPAPQTPAGPSLPQRLSASPITWVVSLSLAAVLGALLFAGGYLAGAGHSTDTCAAPSEAFAALCDAYGKLQRQYVDELDGDALAEGALRGMFEYGVEDPYSGYMPPAAYQNALDSLSGTFSGIGAEMAVRNLDDPGDVGACDSFSEICALVVVAPLEDSPAQKAGLRAGDRVLAVDGDSVEGLTLENAVNRVRGESGTDVTLTIQRDDETFDLTITRAEIKTREVTSRMLDDGTTGYIALHNFSNTAADQFHEGLSKLLDDGATAIIFDLRDNPGGYIDAANSIASEFIASGVTFIQKSSGDDTKEWEATGSGIATKADLPVIVLINGGSASASEIVAGALQDRERATLVGQPTFGKNTVQVWSDLVNGGGVRITISRWFTPDHHSAAPDGIQPDVIVEIPDDTPPERDLILERAREVLAHRNVGGSAAAAPSTADASAAGLRASSAGLDASSAGLGPPLLDPARAPLGYDPRGLRWTII